jgi:hypothetical protein
MVSDGNEDLLMTKIRTDFENVVGDGQRRNADCLMMQIRTPWEHEHASAKRWSAMERRPLDDPDTHRLREQTGKQEKMVSDGTEDGVVTQIRTGFENEHASTKRWSVTETKTV